MNFRLSLKLTYSKSKAWLAAGFTWTSFSVVVSRSISRSRPWWLIVFFSSTRPRRYSMYVCKSTFVFKKQVRFGQNIYGHLCKRDCKVEQEPDVDHLDVRGLRQGVRHTYKPLRERVQNVTIAPHVFFNIFFTYIVVSTSMTVKLTVMMASKKKGLKYTVMWPIVFSRTVGT